MNVQAPARAARAVPLTQSLVRNLTKRTCKDQESICRNRDRGRAGKVVHSRAIGFNCASIPGDYGVYPVVVDIAVKNLEPAAAAGKSDRVVVPGVFRQA